MSILMTKTTTNVILFLSMAIAILPVEADVSLQFSSDNGASFANNFTLVGGTNLNLSVFLTDNTGSNILDSEGLLGFGLTANLSTIGNGIIASAMINPIFETQAAEFDDDGFEWTAFTLLNPVPMSPAVFLGEFQFTGGNVGSAVIGFNDPQPGSSSKFVNTLSGEGTELDELIFGPGGTDTIELKIEVTQPIPEPQGFFVILSCALLAGHRRKRR